MKRRSKAPPKIKREFIPPPPPALKPFADLPTRTKRKILIRGDETTACWEWTGALIQEKARKRTYTAKGKNAVERNTTACRINARGFASVHCAEVGYPVPGHRYVYGLAVGIPYRQVPTLSRCTNDDCVSPHHAIAIGPIPGRRPQAAEGQIDVMAILKAKRPMGELSRESAADECSLALELLTPEIWATYARWDANQDD